jgi:hypothetical protein
MRHNCFRSTININDFPSSIVARRCSRTTQAKET